MKKVIYFIILIYVPKFCFAQTFDTLTITQTIDSLIRVSHKWLEENNGEKSLVILKSADKLCKKTFGISSQTYASICYEYGDHYETIGDFINAEKWFKNAIEIQGKANQSLEYAKTLNALANIYADQGQIGPAENYYKIALDIREQKLGKSHPDYARILNNLAGVYQFTGEYDKAISLFNEVKKIFGSINGIDSIEYAFCLHNLANVYFEIGNYNQAELYYTNSLSIREKLNGRNDPQCAASINCLGNLYSAMGLPDKALNLFQEALEIYRSTVGENNFYLAGCLNNIAEIFSKRMQFDQAEDYYLKAKAIFEKTLGKESPDYAMTIDNMANMYFYKQDFKQAEKLYLEAFEIRKNIFGLVHPEVANSLSNLGNFYTNRNMPLQARPYLTQAKEVWEKIFGKDHPDYVLALNNLICHYWLTNQNKELKESLIESNRIEKKLVSRASKHLSEFELSSYIKVFSSSLDRVFSYCDVSHSLQGECYNNVLFYKGYLLNAAAQISRIAHLDSNLIETFNELKLCNQNLSRELTLPLENRSKDKIESLEENINIIEKDLARKGRSLEETQKEIGFQDLIHSLKPNEAVIEFVHFNFIKAEFTDSIIYAALLIRKDLLEPVYIKLFEQKSLDSLLKFENSRQSEYVNTLYTLTDRGIKDQTNSRRNLADILWTPLEPFLAGINTVYYASTGLLHRINFDAIAINDQETIADSYHLIGFGSTRQLVQQIPFEIKNNDAVLFGGINFEEDTISNNKNRMPTEINSDKKEHLLISNNDMKLTIWDFLPGTEREVNSLQKIMQSARINVNLKKGYEATEESFKNIGTNNKSSPRILHIATHGYFFPDLKESLLASVTSPQNEIVFKTSDHPMLRSGLIMAGGNAAWQGKQTLEGKEDGILTAYEISQMNLSNTELVVLSACETGLGDIQGNEGVYGLQRAFKIAGAKYLIMSLWQVPDKQTSLLMTTFYKKWLEDKMSIPDAFHAAQKQMRENGLDPYNWAGFVLVE
ncbi:MAG: CHAT domain-containing protein [Saprospiraceae bacterium]|nr:CHAT domain-containing protein [Saprospiraceae bacterium]